MNIRCTCAWKAAIDTFAVFCLLVLAGLAQAQPKPPTQKELDTMEAALKKLPTLEQSDELKRIDDEDTKKNELLNPEIEKLSQKIEQDTKGPSFNLTKAHIQAAMANHKKLRTLFSEQLGAIADWGRKTNRVNCSRQAEKTRLYMIRVSDQWLTKTAALPLSTVEDRLYAAQYVMAGGGGETFQPDLPPSGDTRYWVGTELIGLGNVCLGGKEEYMPGTE